MDHDHDGYADPVLREINANRVNWDPGREPSCLRCLGLSGWPPGAGSYATTLVHYERALGMSLDGKRERLRCMILFQDPRSYESGFTFTGPVDDPAALNPLEHRYFCLTEPAWRSLRLARPTGSRGPRWPEPKDAHHFLRRYFGGGSWSYDGFLAYFLWLLRPGAAYITNLAKCHLGEGTQPAVVYKTCANEHLRAEVEAFKPTVLLSFTSRISSRPELRKLCGGLRHLPDVVLRPYHAAARKKHSEKVRRFEDELEDNRDALERLGLDVTFVLDTWRRDAARLGISPSPPTEPRDAGGLAS